MIIRQANEVDAKFIANNLRQSDKDEFHKVTGSHDFFSQIIHGLNHEKSVTYAIELGGTVSAIVGSIEKQDFQVVWACATDNVMNHKISFIKALRHLTKRHEIYRKPFVNYVDCENENAVKFLKASGFTLLDKQPYGKLQKEFYPFIK